LKELCFHHEDDYADHLLHIEPFVERSDCSLQRLSIKGSPAARITANILQKCPSIIELDIFVDVDEDLDVFSAYETFITFPT
jgi:hypothetical protein